MYYFLYGGRRRGGSHCPSLGIVLFAAALARPQTEGYKRIMFGGKEFLFRFKSINLNIIQLVVVRRDRGAVLQIGRSLVRSQLIFH